MEQINQELAEYAKKLEEHIITEKERERMYMLMVRVALKNYIINIINDEKQVFEKRIKKIYQMILYCSGDNVPFPETMDNGFYRTKEWKEISDKIRKRDNYICQICYIKGTRLEVHHIVPKNLGGTENQENLLTLCKKCHGKMPKLKDTKIEIDELKELQMKQNLSKRQLDFIEIYKKRMGLISAACTASHIERVTYYRWLKIPKFKERIEEANVEIKDFGEAALYKSIDNGDVASIIFYNKTKNKERGYIERERPEIVNILQQKNTQVNIAENIHQLIEKAKNKEWEIENV